ncbi:MAG TPA: ChaN family lipoprotein [Chitinophagaceae bacterium]|jgi:uncharacterized iron-regulated protein|nr:ChaN family lipoprotein [Chitinophagaceae bacterium]
MKKIFMLLPALAFVTWMNAQDKPAYILYNAKGKKTSFKKMIKMLQQQDVVLFGEFHNNPIDHWLELEVAKELKQYRDLVLGAEMFEQDNQQALDLYLKGTISEKGLDSMARLWKNYKTDYAPLVNFANENKIAFAATNIPRRYASLVAKGSFEALDTITALEKSWMAPLPIDYDSTLPGYKNMLNMMPGHSGSNIPKAQAIKDATMAYFILKYYQPGKLMIHYNGAYHSENHEGILWYLRKSRPDLKYATITTVLQKDIHKLLAENKSKADYIICVDEDMTTTY